MSTWEKLFIVAWETFFSWCLWPNWIQTIYSVVSSYEVSWPHLGGVECLGTHPIFRSEFFIHQHIWNLYAFIVIFMIVSAFQLLGKWQNHSSSQRTNKQTYYVPTFFTTTLENLKYYKPELFTFSSLRIWGLSNLWISFSFPELRSSRKLHRYKFVVPFWLPEEKEKELVCVIKALGINTHPVLANKPIPSCLWHSVLSNPFSKDTAETCICKEPWSITKKLLLFTNMKDLNNSQGELRVLYILYSALLLFFFIDGLSLVLSV